MLDFDEFDLPEPWRSSERHQVLGGSQGQVWRLKNTCGQVAFLKCHQSVGSYHRERLAYKLLGETSIAPRCYQSNDGLRWLLIEEAGVGFESIVDDSRRSTQLIHRLSALHSVGLAANDLSASEALRLRWQRVAEHLSHLISDELSAWFRTQLDALPDVPRCLVHRDIRPSHLFWCSTGLRLIDFGQARVDFVFFDAIPFYTGAFDGPVAEAVRQWWKEQFGPRVEQIVEVFAVLYLFGTLERVLIRGDYGELTRARQQLDALARWGGAPLAKTSILRVLG